MVFTSSKEIKIIIIISNIDCFHTDKRISFIIIDIQKWIFCGTRHAFFNHRGPYFGKSCMKFIPSSHTFWTQTCNELGSSGSSFKSVLLFVFGTLVAAGPRQLPV